MKVLCFLLSYLCYILTMADPQAPILITTPTGNIGRHVTDHLLEAGVPTRLFVRNENALSVIAKAKADIHMGDLGHAESLRAALHGVRSVFYLAPPNLEAENFIQWYRHLGATLIEALEDESMPRIVFLSSEGVHLRDTLGPITALGALEGMLRDAVEHVTFLRAGYFMENFLASLSTIAHDGMLYNALPPTMPIPMVATRDIAEVATRWLRSDDWTGHEVAGVHGPADRTMQDAADVFSEALGRPVQYQQVSPEAVAEGLVSMGATPGVAADYAAMVAGLAHYGRDYRAEPRTGATTTPTTLETFAREVLRPTYDMLGIQA